MEYGVGRTRTSGSTGGQGLPPYEPDTRASLGVAPSLSLGSATQECRALRRIGESSLEDSLVLQRWWSGIICAANYRRCRHPWRMIRWPGPLRSLGYTPRDPSTWGSLRERWSRTSKKCGEIGCHPRSKFSSGSSSGENCRPVWRWRNGGVRPTVCAVCVGSQRTAIISSSHAPWRGTCGLGLGNFSCDWNPAGVGDFIAISLGQSGPLHRLSWFTFAA